MMKHLEKKKDEEVVFALAVKIGNEKLAICIQLPAVFGHVILVLMRQVARIMGGLFR